MSNKYQRNINRQDGFSLWELSLVILIMIGLFVSATNSGQKEVSFDSWLTMLALSSFELANIFMTFILILGFLLIFMKNKGERFLLKFAP